MRRTQAQLAALPVAVALARVGLSDDALANHLGASFDAVRKWRIGRRRIPIWHVLTLHRDFGLPRHELRPDLFAAPAQAPSRPSVHDIVRLAGGAKVIARAINRSPSGVPAWRRVPEEHVLTVAHLAGLHPHQVRPDLYGPGPWRNEPGPARLSVHDIVRLAGGPKVVARAVNLSPWGVMAWPRVPERHVLTVAELAGLHPHQVRSDLYGPPVAAPERAA